MTVSISLHPRRALVSTALLVGVLVLLPACTLWDPQEESADGMRSRLATTVSSAQDTVWQSRAAILADAEAAVPELPGMRDARLMATPRSGYASYTLIELEVAEQSTTLTLMTSAADSRGGGLLVFSTEGMTCFVLTLSHPSPRSVTAGPSDCTNARGFDRSGYLGLGEDAIIVPFEELDARESVDATTYETGPCQCSSGGDCGCPGG